MTEHISEEAAWALFRKTTAECGGFATTQNLMNAAIQQYLEKLQGTLPVLPEPVVPEGDWFVRDCYTKEYAKSYAIHSITVVLNEAERRFIRTAAELGIVNHHATKALLSALKGVK